MLPLLLGLLEADDARLAVKATLDAPRLTYAELGAWVQKASGVPVNVSSNIRERKATVLVEDRPVRETMDRVADALFLEWEPTKDGYTLRLAPKVAGEEASLAAMATEARHAALKQRVEDLAAFAAKSNDELKAEGEKDDAEATALDKETDPALRMRRAVLIDRARTVSNLRYSGSARASGLLLASRTPAERAAIFDGTVFYASNQPGLGLAPVPPAAIQALGENYPMVKTARTVVFSMRYDPADETLSIAHGIPEPNGYSGGGGGESTGDALRVSATVAASPMGKRLREWAKADAATMATPLAPRKEMPVPTRRQTPYETLAEVLVDLHARTGLPIVADGFRLALVAKRLPEGKDVAAWRSSLGNLYVGGTYAYRGYQPLVRAQDGWLMMRHPRYWQQLAREVPEGPIRRLEAAARSGRVALNDVAAFGAAVTPAQAPWLAGDNLVMDAPSEAVAGKVGFLRLWASLPPVLRQTAISERGLEARALPPTSYQRLMACLDERRGSVLADEKTIPYLLPGGPSLPDDLRLFVNPNATTQNQEYEEFDPEHPGTGWNFPRDGVPGIYATIGVLGGPSFQSYQVPLRPSRKLWPDEAPANPKSESAFRP